MVEFCGAFGFTIRSFIRLAGVPFRIARFFIGLLFYALFLFVSAAIFLIWLCAPAYIVMRIITG